MALDHVDLEIEPGECFGLLGPNGAGKTTAVEILGRTWGRDADALRSRIGVALQDTRLPDRLSVRECLDLFASLYPRSRPVDGLLGEIALLDKQDALVRTLSGGQRQRLAIGCGLVGAPELLFLDEPTTGLDPQSRRRIWELVLAFRAGGGTVVLTTHYMDEAERLCDRLAILDEGRVVREGRPQALVAETGDAHVLEVRVERGALTSAELLGLAGVRSARTDEDQHTGQWTLGVDEPQRALPALFALAARRGLVLANFAFRAATLEDVFVRLTGRQLRDA